MVNPEKREKLIHYIKTTSFILALVVLFILQNLAFNKWLNLSSPAYFVRLFFVTFSLGAILYAPSLLFKKKMAYFYLFFIAFVISVVFTAQFLYFKYSSSFLQFSAIKYFWQADSVAGTIKILLSWQIMLFWSNLVLIAIGFFFAFKKKFAGLSVPILEKAIIVFGILFVVFFGYNYLLSVEKKEWGNTSRLYNDVYDLKSLTAKIGIINFSIEDTVKYFARINLVSKDDETFLQNFAKSQKAGESENKYFGLAKGKNIIIIQVESLENVVINQKIGGQEITPNLNKLANSGLYFDNYYALAGPGNTADAEFSTITSLYPLPDDVAFINYAKNNYNALPKLLKNNGYDTYVMHGDVPTFWNRSNVYPSLGYDKAFCLQDYVVTKSVGKGPSDLGDEDLFLQSLPRLENLQQPFLTTVITMSSHTPFILPNDLQTLQIPAELNLGWMQAGYLQSIHYTDKAIGEFIDGLKKDGLYDNSIILIYGDHDSYTGITSNFEPNKNALPKMASSQVPLIVLGTGLNKTISEPGSPIDIYPTIANLLGILPAKTIFGQDLLNTKNPVAVNFNQGTGTINSILTTNLGYTASNDGVFENGNCISIPDRKTLPVNDCQNIYSLQTNTLKASNIIVRGNLLDIYSSWR